MTEIQANKWMKQSKPLCDQRSGQRQHVVFYAGVFSTPRLTSNNDILPRAGNYFQFDSSLAYTRQQQPLGIR